jgi:hypothetical protein
MEPFHAWDGNKSAKRRDRAAMKVFNETYPWIHGEYADVCFRAFVAGYELGKKEARNEKS